MKNLKLLPAGVLTLACGIIFGLSQVNAGGSGGIIAASISPSTNSVNVGGTIVFAINTHYYWCISSTNPEVTSANETPTCPAGYEPNPAKMPQPNKPGTISVTGSGNTLSPATFTTDGAGNAQFGLSSSVAETKTVKIYDETNTLAISTSVTFTATAAPSPAAALTPKTTTAPKPAVTATAEPTPPLSPTLEIKIGDTTIKPEDKPTIKQNEPLVLSGKTVVSGVVNIYIFSEPKKYTTTADKDGNWTYTVDSSDLPPGDHHIEAEVTDPATGKTSPRAQVLAFSVEKAVAKSCSSDPSDVDCQTTATTQNTPEAQKPIIFIILGLGIVVLAACTWIFRQRILHALKIK